MEMETEYTLKKETEKLEQEKTSKQQRIEALLSQIKKYQTGIKDIQTKMCSAKSEEAYSQYQRMIGDHRRLQRQFGKELREIYAAGLPSPKSILRN